MIIFENENELYTKLAQSYLESYIDIYNDINETIEEKIEAFKRFFPPLVYLENQNKCFITFLKIGEWARDKFYHRLGSLEKLVIYNVLNDMDQEIKNLGPNSFCEIYFKKTQKEIIEILKEYHFEDIQEIELDEGKPFSDDEIFDFFICSDYFNDTLFEDIDEEDIVLLLDDNDENLALIDEYFYDVLPNDIINRIKKNKKLIDFTIDDFMNSFKQMIEKSFYRIYGFENYREKDFQILFEFYARSFNKVSLEFDKVFREVEIGNGRIDFMINFPFSGDILFELKMDRGENVRQAILFQIPEYLENLKKDKAIIIIFSSKDDNEEYLDFCKKVFEDKRKNIYPFMINIFEHSTPSQKKR